MRRRPRSYPSSRLPPRALVRVNKSLLDKNLSLQLFDVGIDYLLLLLGFLLASAAATGFASLLASAVAQILRVVLRICQFEGAVMILRLLGSRGADHLDSSSLTLLMIKSLPHEHLIESLTA